MTDESKVTVEDTDEKGTDDVTTEDDSLEALLNELDSEDSEDEEKKSEEDADEKEEESDGKDDSKEDKVAKLEKELNDVKATLGRVKKAKTTEGEAEPKKDSSDINSEMAEDLLILKHPEAKEVLDTLKEHAKMLNKSVYELYKSDPSYQKMATALHAVEKEEEDNLSKVNKPGGASFTGKSVEDVTDEDMEKMTPAQRKKVLNELARREGA